MNEKEDVRVAIFGNLEVRSEVPPEHLASAIKTARAAAASHILATQTSLADMHSLRSSLAATLARSKTKSRSLGLAQSTYAGLFSWDGTPINVQFDPNGHITSATNADKKGINRKVSFPRWPIVTSITYEEDGLSPLVMGFVVGPDTISFTGQNATKLVQQTLWPSDGPEYSPAYKMQVITTENGIVTPGPLGSIQKQKDIAGYLKITNVASLFPKYKEVMALFHPIVLKASQDIQDAFGFTPQWVQQYPEVAPEIVFYSLGWGSVGRAVLWGLAGIGGFAAGVAATAAAPVVITVDLIMWGVVTFLLGYDASIWGEIWSAFEDANDPLTIKKSYELKP